MIKYLYKFLIILALVILQLALFSKFSVYSSVPNLIFLVSLILLLKNRQIDAFYFAIVGGFLLDLWGVSKSGLFLIALPALLIVGYYILQKMSVTNFVGVFGYIFISFLALNLVFAIAGWTWLGWNFIIDSLVNGLWGVFLFILTDRYFRRSEIPSDLSESER